MLGETANQIVSRTLINSFSFWSSLESACSLEIQRHTFSREAQPCIGASDGEGLVSTQLNIWEDSWVQCGKGRVEIEVSTRKNGRRVEGVKQCQAFWEARKRKDWVTVQLFDADCVEGGIPEDNGWRQNGTMCWRRP